MINNPLNLTDPSGYLWGHVAWAVGSYLVGRYAAKNNLPWLAMAAQIVGCASGFCPAASLGGTYGSTGNPMLAMMAAVAAGTLGHMNLHAGAQLAANGMIGGIGSAMMGGRFEHGFAAGAIGTFGAGGGMSGLVRSVIVGGTVSHITGGKFKNGAASAAFAWALRAGIEAASASRYDGKTLSDFEGENVVEIRYNKIGGMPYKHAYVVVTDSDGNQYFVRAGPSGGPDSGMSGQFSLMGTAESGLADGAWGSLVVDGGHYLPGSIDYQSVPDASQIVYVSSGPVQPILDKLASFANDVNQANIAYRPLSTNSNAFAHQAVTALGINRLGSVAFSPGSGTHLELE